MARSHLTAGGTVATERYLTVPEQLAQWIRSKIADGTYGRGDHLVQLELIDRYEQECNKKVSRMPLRDALRLLEADGLVTIYPNQGAVVTTLSLTEVHEIYMIRKLLEMQALRLAFERGNLTRPTLSVAEGLYEQMEHATTSAEWRQYDEEFHTLLYESAQSPRLVTMVTNLRQQVTRLFFVKQQPVAYRERFQRKHRQILDACIDGDKAAALRALEEHLDDSEDVIGAEVT